MARLNVSALVVSIADDAFAPEIAVRRFLMGLPSAPMVRRPVRIRGRQKAIGHFGFFRSSCSHEWTVVSKFLKTAVPHDGNVAATP
jgi:predicted alpha/beta hydrolase